MSDAVPCPGSTASRRHVIASDARVCHICGWVRGERDALRLQPLARAPRSEPAVGRRKPRPRVREGLLLVISALTITAIAMFVGAGSPIPPFGR